MKNNSKRLNKNNLSNFVLLVVVAVFLLIVSALLFVTLKDRQTKSSLTKYGNNFTLSTRYKLKGDNYSNNHCLDSCASYVLEYTYDGELDKCELKEEIVNQGYKDYATLVAGLPTATDCSDIVEFSKEDNGRIVRLRPFWPGSNRLEISIFFVR